MLDVFVLQVLVECQHAISTSVSNALKKTRTQQQFRRNIPARPAATLSV